MKRRHIVFIIVAVFGSLAALWYLMARLLTVPTAGVVIVLAPTALVTVLAVIYGYHEGAKRQRARLRQPFRAAALSPSYMFGLAVIALIAGIAEIRLALYGHWVGAATVAVGFVVVLTIGVIASRHSRVRRGAEPAVIDDFEVRFRGLVFGLVAGLPVAFLAIFLLWVRDVEEAVVFLVISAAAVPWAVYKLRRQSPHRPVR